MNLSSFLAPWMAATATTKMSTVPSNTIRATTRKTTTTRMLHNQRAHFNVQLFLDLQFVDEALALDFESLDWTNPNVMHFCKSVQTQVFGDIVTEAARDLNATIVSDHDEIDPGGDGLQGCDIVATSRVYDTEAEDVFGTGYCSLQVHVSQSLVVESSNQTLYLEVVQSVVEKGFDVVSGGQREFRNHLYENPLFRSVIEVTIRRGLTAPVHRPTPRPTVVPTQRPTPRPTTRPPTKIPTHRPSNRPTTRPPTNIPTHKPSNRPTFRPSQRPTRFPTNAPTPRPSKRPTPRPTKPPTRNPTIAPSVLPTQSPSTSPSITPTLEPSEVPSFLPISSVNWNRNEVLQNDSVLVAAILGISVVLATLSCLVCLLCYKYHKSNRYSNVRSPIPLSMNHSHNFIPGIVEVGDDHQSLDDTTLGDYTFGKSFGRKRPSIRKGLGGSFDENSLFTSPFAIDEPEQRASAIPPPSMTLLSVQSSLSGNLMTPLEYEKAVIFPTCDDSASDEEKDAKDEGMEVLFPRSKRSSGPIDMDSNQPYDEQEHNPTAMKIMKIEPLQEQHPPLATLHEHDDFSRIPSDLDVWSCDFEDFDNDDDNKTLEFAKAEDHSTSRLSSASTKRINNTIMPSSSSISSSSLLTTKPKLSPLKPIPPPSVAKPRKLNPNIGRKRAIPHTTALLMQQSKDRAKSTPAPHSKSHVSSIALKLQSDTKPPASSSTITPPIDNKSKPRIVSPDEESQTSAKVSIQSKNSILSDMSKDTKTGAPTTTTMDCLSRSGGLLVSSLKDGVTTIHSLKEGAAPKIDSLSNGIVNSLRDGAPRIEKMGNGLVSSLTDIFDRMAIPKITPEEYVESSVASMTSQSTAALEGTPPKDKFLTQTVSDDDDSGISASPWLMGKVEDTLGPKSVHADLASLNSHKTPRRNRDGSEVSYGSKTSMEYKSRNRQTHGSEVSFGSRKSYYRPRKLHNGSEVSFGSRNSYYSHCSSQDVASLMSKASASMSADLADETPGEISIKPSRIALEEQKKRLEQQLAELDDHDSVNNVDKASSVTMSSVTWGSFSTISSRSRTFRDRRQVIVCVPPGKLGVILADYHDKKGTVINSIKSGSPVEGILKPGDILIAVDEIAVVKMSCSQITSLIASRAEKERRFTVMTKMIKEKKDNNDKSASMKKT